MDNIEWTKNGTGVDSNYNIRIGGVFLWCVPIQRSCPRRRVGWVCVIEFENEYVKTTKRRKSLRLCQKDGEKLAIEYLLGFGLIFLRDLKKLGLLEEVLSEIGIGE